MAHSRGSINNGWVNERKVVAYMKGPTVPQHTGSTVLYKVAVVLSIYQSKPALMDSF